MTNREKYKTAEERARAFDNFCKPDKKCKECLAVGYNCAFNWLDLEADESGEECDK